MWAMEQEHIYAIGIPSVSSCSSWGSSSFCKRRELVCEAVAGISWQAAGDHHIWQPAHLLFIHSFILIFSLRLAFWHFTSHSVFYTSMQYLLLLAPLQYFCDLADGIFNWKDFTLTSEWNKASTPTLILEGIYFVYFGLLASYWISQPLNYTTHNRLHEVCWKCLGIEGRFTYIFT